MVDHTDEPEAPFTCEETIEEIVEDDNRIDDETDIDPIADEEEKEDLLNRQRREEIEQQFARYERNYRSRRIRELMKLPIKKRGRKGRHSDTMTV